MRSSPRVLRIRAMTPTRTNNGNSYSSWLPARCSIKHHSSRRGEISNYINEFMINNILGIEYTKSPLHTINNVSYSPFINTTTQICDLKCDSMQMHVVPLEQNSQRKKKICQLILVLPKHKPST